MAATEIPANTMAVELGRNIASTRTVTIKIEKVQPGNFKDKNYIFTLGFPFEADVVTPVATPPGTKNFTAFDVDGTILATTTGANIYFSANGETIELQASNVQTLSTDGIKVRSGLGAAPQIMEAIESLSDEEKKNLFQLFNPK